VHRGAAEAEQRGVDPRPQDVEHVLDPRLAVGRQSPQVRPPDHHRAGAEGERLIKTGGVITSAGLILAGTFCTLLATELESLFQVGFTVALGLLVDTFLIRIFLVPSIALLLRSRAI
jgi:hypothetical protein